MRGLFLVLTVLFGATAFGLNLPPTSKEASYFYYKNKVVNPGFENGASNWTASGGSFTVTTTAADLAEGLRSAVFDASATAQTLSSSNYTIERGLRQNNAYAKCRVRTTATDYILDVYDGTNVLASQTIQATTEFSEQGINFVFPTSGTARIRIRSQSNAAAIYVDDCYLGAAPNIQAAHKSQFVGSSYFTQTTNCSWSRTNTAIGAFSTDADCPGPTVGVSKIGSWQTTDADLPRQTINSLPEGLYSVEVTGSLYGGGDWTMAVSDGTTTSPVYCSGSGNGGGTFQPSTTCIAWFEYSAEGNRSFEIYGSSSSGAISLDNNANNDRTTFTVKRWDRYPSTFASINNTDFGWTDGGTNTITATTTNPTKGGTIVVDKVWYRRTGDSMQVRIEYRQNGGTAGNAGSGDYLFRVPGGFLIDTTKVTTYTTVEGNGTFRSNNCVGTGQILITDTQGPVCPVVYDTQNVRLFSAGYTDGATPSRGVVSSAAFGLATSEVMYHAMYTVPIQGWSQNQSTPVFVGSVSSNSSGAEKFERAKLNCDASSSITSQSGSWITSIGNRSGTSCALTLPSANGFSAAPTCTFTINAATVQATSIQTSSATSVTIYGPSADYDGELLCMGPR